MNEKNENEVAYIHQKEIELFYKDMMILIMEKMEGQSKFSTSDMLLSTYGACLEVAYKLDIYAYKELLENVKELTDDRLIAVYEGFEAAEKGTKPAMRLFQKPSD
jgi:hypothetical protein